MDAWCTAFVARKVAGAPEITTATLRALAVDPTRVGDATRDSIAAATAQYGFFHWPLEFPAVSERGGFDVVLGNPPWEHTELKEKEFFAERHPMIAEAKTGAARKRLIEELAQSDPDLYRAFIAERRRHDATSHFLGNSDRFPKCGRGRINLYAVFAEAMRAAVGPSGRLGAVLPTGIATDDTTKYYFQDVVATRSLVSLFDFENKGIFPGVHSSYKFCLFTAGSGGRPVAAKAEFVFFAHAVDDLVDAARRFTLSPDDIELLNPNTRTCPIFRSRADAELAKAIYRRVPVLIRDDHDGVPETNPWGIRFRQGLFNMTSDSHLFRTREQLEATGWRLDGNVFGREGDVYSPLYEGRFGHQFNHRFAEQPAGDLRELTKAELADPERLVEPQFWVSGEVAERELNRHEPECKDGLLGLRRVARNTDERTCIASVIPWGPASYGWILSEGVRAIGMLVLAGQYNSWPLDFLLRSSLSQPSVPQGTFAQVPALPENALSSADWTDDKLMIWLRPRLLELTFTAYDLGSFARSCGWSGPPFRWNDDRRFLIRAELDAAFLQLYLPTTAEGAWRTARLADGAVRDETDAELGALRGHFPTPRHAVAHILDSFPIVRRKDEEAHGEYRTKRVILEVYDAMQEATRTGIPYRTRIDPPPGDPRGAHLPRYGEPVGEWRDLEPPASPATRSAPGLRPASRRVAAPTQPAPAARRPVGISPARPVPGPPGAKESAAQEPPPRPSADRGGWLPETKLAASEVLFGTRVRHRTFGPGTVLGVETRNRSSEMLIRFERAGEKWIAFGLGLLEFER